jgi:hypothetical protein
MRSLHSHSLAWSVVAPLLVIHLVPHFTEILPFLSLVSMVVPIALLLFMDIPAFFPLIDLLLLRACPSNHGLSVVVITPVLYPHCS